MLHVLLQILTVNHLKAANNNHHTAYTLLGYLEIFSAKLINPLL